MREQTMLFEEYPYLEDDLILIHKMRDEDAAALERMCAQEEVYTYVPAFLFEKKYAGEVPRPIAMQYGRGF